MAMEGYERARSTLARLETDMSAGFTARELGDTYQFYGTSADIPIDERDYSEPRKPPRLAGLCFVGNLESGKLGRVTYVLRNKPERAFSTQIGEQAIDLFTRAFNHDLATGVTVSDLSLSVACELIRYCVSTGLFAADIGDVWLRWIGDSFGAGKAAPPPTDPGANQLIELTVNIETGALLRYEEQNARDLETFELMPCPSILPQWPGDRPYSDYSGECQELMKAIMSAGDSGISEDQDLRKLIYDNTAQLRTLRPEIVTRILNAKRSDLWICMLTFASGDSFAQVVGESPDAYELVDQILLGAFIPGVEGTPLHGFDVLGVPPIFSYTNGGYGNSALKDKPTFNTLSDIPGYLAFYTGASDVMQFDEALNDGMSGGWTTGADVGSPMDTRLPYSIQVGFWIVLESRSPAVNDFRRWFTQVIEIPCAFTRKG